MAYSVRMQPGAEAEVDGIVDYLLGHGPATASRFLDALEAQIGLLSSGTIDYGLSKLPEIATLGYHSCHVGSYVMLYFIEGDDLVIAHVFHQTRDYARLL